jgi:UDP-glucose 4-epimerase
MMPNYNRKILLTGANGFIGCHLTRRLLNEGYQIGIIKRENSDMWRIEDVIHKLTVFSADLADTKSVFKVFVDFSPDIVIHLAAHHTVEHQPSEIPLMVNTNLTGTLNLLEASKSTSVYLFINTSSCFVYKEDNNKLTEKSPLKPLNLYALTKLQAEQACNFYNEKYGLKTVTLRLFPPYGPADNERKLIPFVINSLNLGNPPEMTSGLQKWDFIYVEDIVEAYIKLINCSDSFQCEIFNIGTGTPVSVREVVKKIEKSLKTTSKPIWGVIPHRKNESWFNSADINKAKKILNWEPRTTLEEGLKLTVDWYKSFGWLRKND